jgi:hypothetical protein
MVAAVICESEGPVIAVALTKGSWEVIFGPTLHPSEKALAELRKRECVFHLVAMSESCPPELYKKVQDM